MQPALIVSKRLKQPSAINSFSLRITPVLVAFILTLLACKKESSEDKIIFPITMYAEKAEVVSDTKIYIKGGQLNDPQKATELMWIYARHFTLEQNFENAGEQYLRFISKDSVSFFNNHSPYLVEKSGDRLMMKSSIQFLAAKPMLPDQLYHHVTKYRDVKLDGNTEISRDIRLAYGDGYKELKIPVFAYVTSSRISTQVHGLNYRGGLIVNEFNEDVLNRIGDNDTIIVKKYMITVKAK